GPGAVSTRIHRDGDGYRVTGSKYYSTGGLHAQWFSGTARDEHNNIVSFSVPTDRAGVTLLDDFDAIGQRLTASGTTLFDEAYLSADEVAPENGRSRRPATALPQLYLAAVLAGIAESALDDAVAFARDVARPIKHSSAEVSVEDPYVRHAVGDIASHAIAARGAVLLAAEALGNALSTAEDAPGFLDTALRATVTVASAQQSAARDALAAAEAVFDVGGGRAIRREHHLDRHWRNARTVTNHNPRAWKSAVVGAYLLTGETPPDNGLF
ncbi:MAG: acyl-CoA dehydrogenase, partial [Glaciihabitans sp.]|nr:acyl-CoA dehydrogenase [Glaciihabitans sp.]